MHSVDARALLLPPHPHASSFSSFSMTGDPRPLGQSVHPLAAPEGVEGSGGELSEQR